MKNRKVEDFSEYKIVNDITARNALELFKDLKVHVKDAAADPNIRSEYAGYIYDGTQWIITYQEKTIQTTDRTIYIDASTGDDITGDGTSSDPFQTISRGLQELKDSRLGGAMITYDLAAGNYDLNENDVKIINDYEVKGVDTVYAIKFKGGFDTIHTGATITQQAGDDKTLYDLAGISVTSNELRSKFAYDGSKYYPINRNGTDWVEIAGSGLSLNGNIYSVNVSITYSGATFNLTRKLDWTNVELNINPTESTGNVFAGVFESGIVKWTVAFIDTLSNVELQLSNLFLDVGPWRIVMDGAGSQITINNSVIRTERTAISTIDFNTFLSIMNTSIFENYGSKSIALGFSNYNIISTAILDACYIKFIHFTAPFDIRGNENLRLSANSFIILDDCDYIFNEWTLGLVESQKTIFIPNPIIGTPNTARGKFARTRIKDMNSLYLYYVNGYDYPEDEVGLSETLTNDATTTL